MLVPQIIGEFEPEFVTEKISVKQFELNAAPTPPSFGAPFRIKIVVAVSV